VLVIFDCDGVLVDSEPLANRELAGMLTEIGLPTTTEESMAAFMGRAWDTITPLIEARLAAPLPETFIDTYYERVFAAFDAELQPVEGIEQALDQIEAMGHVTCVASSGPHERIRRALAKTNLLPRFPDSHIFSAQDVQRGKPAPDLFLNAQRTLDHAPQDCVVVEDAPTGVEAARRAQMRVLGYNTEADITFKRMAELPALLGAPR
jgi:HAD superfamily hydrolase (TIGR01509 family)